jgi:hypothetical protein
MIQINHLNNIRIDAHSNQSLKPGDLVTLKVLKSINSAKWLVSIRGKVYPVSSEVTLRSGQLLKGKVFSEQNRLLIKTNIASNKVSANFIVKSGIPNDHLSRMIIDAMIKTGLILNPDKVTHFRKILLKMEKNVKKEAAARLLSILDDKGLNVDEEYFLELYNLITGEGTGDRRWGGENEQEESEESLIKMLKSIINRGSESADNMLHLFNYKKNRGEQWLIVPFNLTLWGERYSGSFRLRVSKGSKAYSQAVVQIKYKNEEWFFSWHSGVIKDRILKISSDSYQNEDSKLKKIILVLERNLHKKGLKFDDIKIDSKKFDGFSMSDELGDMEAVDEFV